MQNNTVAKEFGRTIGSNSYDAVCADLIDAKIAVISTTTSWFTKSAEIAALDLNGSNGHQITVHIAHPSAAILQ